MNENITNNGIISLSWLENQAKNMTPEKSAAILKRNEALALVPSNKRREWVETHPLEDFYEKG